MKPITDVHELFHFQRAIRTFTDEEIPDALVDKGLTAAIHGPSGSNTQPWHCIVIRNPAVKQAISDVYEEACAAANWDRPPAADIARQPRLGLLNVGSYSSNTSMTFPLRRFSKCQQERCRIIFFHLLWCFFPTGDQPCLKRPWRTSPSSI